MLIIILLDYSGNKVYVKMFLTDADLFFRKEAFCKQNRISSVFGLLFK